MLKEFSQVMFGECLHSEFQIIENDRPVCVLKLTDVVERTKTSRQEAFSLIFQGPLVPFGTERNPQI
jgi:hypothetical protein